MATILVEVLGNAKQFKAEMASAEAATGRAQGSFSKFGTAVSVTGAILAGGLAVGLAKSISAAGDFQESLNVMQATTNATNAEMARASALAIKLGSDVHLPAVSAKDAADAMLELGRDGFSASKAMAGARGTLLLVTAAQTDVATSAKVVTQNLNAFHLSAKSTNTIVDQMAGFMNATGTSFDAFSDSLTYTAAISHTVGQSFADNAAQLAILSQNGIEGSQAGTGLRTILSSLGNEGSKASKMLKALGVSTVDQSGHFIGMRDTLAKLQPKLAEMTQSQRLQFLQLAFGKPAMNAANILLGQNAAAYDKTKAAIERKGQADKLAASHMKGFNGAMASLTSSLESLEIEIGLKLLPVATRFLNWLTQNLPAGIALAQGAFQSIKEAVTGVINTIRPALDVASGAFDSVKDAVLGAVGTFMDMKGHSAAIEAALGVVAAAIVGVTIATIAMNLAFLANPVVLLIVGLAALAAGLVLAYENSKTFRDIVNSAFGAIKMAAQVSIGYITETILPALRAAWDRLAPDIAQAIGIIKGIITGFVSQVQQNWGTLTAIFGPVIKGALSSVKIYVTAFKDETLKIFDTFGDVLHGRWSNLWGDLKDLVRIPLVAIKSIVTTTLESVAKSAYEAASRLGKEIISGVLDGLSGLGSALKNKIESTLGSVLGSIDIPGASPPRHAGAHMIGEPIAVGVIEGWLAGSAALPSTMSKTLQDALNTGRGVIQAAQASFQAAWSQLSPNADKAFSGTVGAASTPAERQLANLQAGHDAQGRQQSLDNANAALSAARDARDAPGILAAQQQVADAQYAIQIASLQKRAEAERVQLNARNDLLQTHFDAALTKLQVHLAKGHATYADAHAAILKLFKTFGVNYEDAGAQLGVSFITGLKETIQGAAKQSGSLSGKLESVAAGIKIPHAATGGFVAETGLAVIHQGETITPAGQGGGHTFNFYGWVANKDEVVEAIRNELIRKGRNTTGGALGTFG